MEDLRSKQEAHKRYSEIKFNEMESTQRQCMEKIEEILENQIETNSSKSSIDSSLKSIEKTLTVVSAQSNSSQASIKALEDGIAANAEEEKKREKKIALKYLRHFGLIDERLSKLEKCQQESAVPVQQNYQEHVEASIPPTQSETEVTIPAAVELEDSTDSSAVQKTEFNSNTAAAESQS